jgi:hypothetical protein
VRPRCRAGDRAAESAETPLIHVVLGSQSVDAVTNFHMVWIAQCNAAKDIQARWGTQKALGYLMGEKLVEFLRVAETAPGWRAQVPMFIAEVKRCFSPEEIRQYFDDVRRIGPLGHVLTDEQFEEFRAAGAVEDNAVEGAEDVLRLDRARRLLLERVLHRHRPTITVAESLREYLRARRGRQV